LWVAIPGETVTGMAMAGAASMQIARLSRWAGLRTLPNPIVFVLHAGYGFIPVGFALLAAAVFLSDFPAAAGVHALGAGAIGTMTLAVMVRASLGHTGQQITAGYAGCAIFCAVGTSALLRIAAVFASSETADILLHASAFLWAAAFIGFAIRFAPSLMRARVSPQPAAPQ
jgi:uncharacterized protein involved in response to NO